MVCQACRCIERSAEVGSQVLHALRPGVQACARSLPEQQLCSLRHE